MNTSTNNNNGKKRESDANSLEWRGCTPLLSILLIFKVPGAQKFLLIIPPGDYGFLFFIKKHEHFHSVVQIQNTFTSQGGIKDFFSVENMFEYCTFLRSYLSLHCNSLFCFLQDYIRPLFLKDSSCTNSFMGWGWFSKASDSHLF